MSALETTMTYPSTPLLCRASAVFAVGAALAFGSVASAATILIDFGANAQTTALTGWNNVIPSVTPTNTDVALVNSLGQATTFTISYSDFNNSGGGNPGSNTDGTTGITNPITGTFYPTSATDDSIFGNTGNFGEGPTPVITITLKGLSASETYRFSYFASRTGASDNRSTSYSLTNGTATSAVVLNASNNTANSVASSFMAPSAGGELTLTLTPDASNTNSNGFFYLGVLEITTQTAAIPEPSTYAALAGLAILGFAGVRRRRA